MADLRSFWPARTAIWRSGLRPDEVERRLVEVVDSSVPWHERVFGSLAQRPEARFVGEVGPERFRLHRRIGYRNSFMPWVEGIVTDSDEGSEIRITMRMHAFVTVFVVLWMSVAVALGLIGLVGALAGLFESLLCLVFPLGGGALVGASFRHEAERARQLLLELLEAEETPG